MSDGQAEFYLGTVTNISTVTGVEIQLDGQSSPMTKRYKLLNACRNVLVGERVVVMKKSGTYVVLGAIHNPVSRYNPATLANNASLADVITTVNVVINALRQVDVIRTPS